MRRVPAANLSQRTLAVIMAGGQGARLRELTEWHSKPAISFGGHFRNIDFPLSNCIHSGIRRIALLTQYKAHSLIQHVQHGWNHLSPAVGEFIELWPAQQRLGSNWYAGTADAVYQNLDLMDQHNPDYVLILAGDHVYKMNYASMLERHVASGASITVGCIEVPISEASEFGVVGVDGQGWIQAFHEKPSEPLPLPGNDNLALASMGIYVFNWSVLASCLLRDAQDPYSQHDFGRDIIPGQIEHSHLLAYPFRDPDTGRRGYWRDVGTLESYWRAQMDLLADEPPLFLDDPEWRIWTRQPQSPPARFVGEGSASRSIVSSGCTIAGRLERTVTSTDCRIGPGSTVVDSVLLPNVRIGTHCHIERAIVDSGCEIPDGTVIMGSKSSSGSLTERRSSSIELVTQERLAYAAMQSDRGDKVA